MRRIAQQVPDAVGRLLRTGFLETPPTWYTAVMTNPPPTHPPNKSRSRPSLYQDGGSSKPVSSSKDRVTMKMHRRPEYRPGAPQKPRAIAYPEDRIRRQFFTDFPFEAMRPTSLVELRDLKKAPEVTGEQWTSLSQRGQYPTVEDVVAFTLNLFKHTKQNMTASYKQATSEFVQLRAQHEMATMAAELEARHYGTEFKRDAFERFYKREQLALDSDLNQSGRQATKTTGKAKWVPPKERKWTTELPEQVVPKGGFTGGLEYMKRWRPATPAPAASDAVDGSGTSGTGATPSIEASEPATDLEPQSSQTERIFMEKDGELSEEGGEPSVEEALARRIDRS